MIPLFTHWELDSPHLWICKNWETPEAQLLTLPFHGLYQNTQMYTQRRKNFFQKVKNGSFPGGAVVENQPANAGDTGSSPGLGRSHVPRSSWAREPQLLSLRVWSLCSATREAAIVRGPRTAMKGGPPLATTRESPRTEMKTQHSHK